jgi:hypothetical protein
VTAFVASSAVLTAKSAIWAETTCPDNVERSVTWISDPSAYKILIPLSVVDQVWPVPVPAYLNVTVKAPVVPFDIIHVFSKLPDAADPGIVL